MVSCHSFLRDEDTDTSTSIRITRTCHIVSTEDTAKSLRTLQIKKTLSPGKPGTVRLVEKYGDDLLCVRYRYDAVRTRNVKTVELIVEEGPWEPAPRPIPPDTIVPLRVEYGEVDVGRRIKAAGGTWNRDKRVWELSYQEVVALGIIDRIVTET